MKPGWQICTSTKSASMPLSSLAMMKTTKRVFETTFRFTLEQKFYLAAFNHLMPFPGTPIYKRMERENRLLFEKWWLDDTYRFNMIPFQPKNMTPSAVKRMAVLQTRRKFFNFRNVLYRSFDPVNSSPIQLWPAFFGINSMFHTEVGQRNLFPLGDEGWDGQLIKVRSGSNLSLNSLPILSPLINSWRPYVHD